MPRDRASVKDVALLAGVSVGTVSNVLNHPDTVAERTRRKVEEAMAELRFLRNASARYLRAGVSSTVGTVLRDLGNPFYTEIARGIEDRLAADGQTLMVCSSDEDENREAQFLRQFAEQGVRGLLVTPMPGTADRLAELLAMGIPSILVDSHGSGLPSVEVDHVAGGRQAIEHLLARGHRQILFINAAPDLPQARHRLRGASDAIRAAGLDPSKVLKPATVHALTSTAGEQAMTAALSTPGPIPTAVFGINDLVALGAIRAIRGLGLTVPGDFAVVGYDDLYWAGELTTPLTSVRQPMRQLGWTAADLLLRGGSPTEQIVFTPELIVRASSDFDR